MRREGGYAVIFGPLGIQKECSTFSCAHCNCVVHIKPKCNLDDLGGNCRLCDKLICPKCVDLGCTPFEKKLEQAEARDRWRRAYG